MNFAFLPNYFKKIGIWCFFGSFAIFPLLTFTNLLQIDQESTLGLSAFKYGELIGTMAVDTHFWYGRLCVMLFLLGMAFHILAKEKIEDDYLDVLRWESVRLSIILCIGINILCVLFNYDFPAKTQLIILFISYLIAFSVKKNESVQS
jgi:hypothetical protein